MFGDQANVIGQFKPNNNASYGNTYNSNWRNHPNFSWKPKSTSVYTASSSISKASNLEQAIVNLSKKIDNLQYSISRLTNLNTVQEKGISFSTSPKPKGIHEVETHEGSLHRGLNVNKKAFLTEQEWTHATHVWQHDIGAQYLLYVQKANHSEEEEGPEEVCIIDTLVEEHCNQKMQEKLNESLGDLEEGLPEPQICLLALQGWRRREEILPLFNKEEHKKLLKRRPQSSI
ncbi:hypothetical protein CK203_110380 [Vitis vinifera]|uniref:Uncharacterized protein n=1 Tax=Vitis vinifera TaxID=29760 RepID=A0A438FDD8_VITVI|nr:hypothetical protein CK203_110380 [Vitis vinifera]